MSIAYSRAGEYQLVQSHCRQRHEYSDVVAEIEIERLSILGRIGQTVGYSCFLYSRLVYSRHSPFHEFLDIECTSERPSVTSGFMSTDEI